MKTCRVFLLLMTALALSACAGGSNDPPGAGDTGPTGDTGPQPDMAQPDAAEPEPDVGELDPDMGELDPDMGELDPDMGELDPDMGELDPDMGEPEPDACAPGEELCNGVDDDCDGSADEGFELGGACSAGEGACAADGVVVCGPDGSGTICDAAPAEPGEEVCNGVDDDCDGAVDDGLGGGPCDTGEAGVCADGVLACADGEAACVPAIAASAELCDGLDNDCNGAVDDVPGAGEACTVGAGACAAEGVTACGPQGLGCNAVPGEPADEVCNDVDDDCDGRLDELPECGDEICGNGLDDDGDGAVDCDDPDCADDPGCAPDPVELCGNGLDDDGDGAADCDDPDCADDPGCAPDPVELCGNGLDDDGDGAADCDDPDCADDPGCAPDPVELCGNGLDDDGDGAADCDDPDCADDPACEPLPVELCDNGADDDGDGAVDCDDPDCVADPACRPVLEICDNGVDDDGDGAADCDDPECANLPECQPDPELCDNGADDDGDGAADCDDPDCSLEPICNPLELCDNGIDDDRDEAIDCDDPDCAFDPACAVLPELCDNGLDDDGDDAVDCDDPDCAFDPTCVVPPELCDNLEDDDRDGDIDCDDADCAFFEGCLPDEVCDNAEDDDLDGAVDCDDPDCADDAACAADEATPIADPGGAIGLQGAVDENSPVFDRLDDDCTAADPARSTGHVAHRIVNLTGAPQIIDVEAAWNVGDGFLLIYSVPFDPAAPLDGCLAGNDDDLVLAASAVRGLEIAPGQELVVVATTFDVDQPLGPYDITVTTAAPAVPELCEGGADEDLDGLIDCNDPDCAGDAACGPTPIAPVGESIALQGVLDADSPVFNRPGGGCAPGDNPGRRYQAFPVVNQTGAAQLITTTARWNAGDGYLFVYRAPFDPALPDVGCLGGNDDFIDLSDSQVPEVPIADGEVLVIVASAFDPDTDIGPFDLAVQTIEGGPAVELCDNLLDDDGDGQADCDDADCVDFPACQAEPELCDNGIDDDGDGAIDCDDPDCAGAVQCAVEICDNGLDDNGDGAIDCGDPTCVDFVGCDACPAVDFEAGIPPYFESAGALPWFADAGAASSGAIGDSQDSGLVLEVEVGEGGRVQFAYTVSSENTFDFLRFLIDGVDADSWTGEVPWTTVGFDLAPGVHTLEWRYSKDVNTSSGEDRALIDDIVLLGGVACPGDGFIAPEPIAEPGGSIALVGQLDGASPIFDRPEEDCAGASAGRRYQTFPIINQTGRPQTVTIDGTWNVGDGFLLVYGDFDPADGEAGCLAGDDDLIANDITQSQVVGVPIAAGETLTIVATSFGAGADVGPFDIEVSTDIPLADGTCEAPFAVEAGVYDGTTEGAPSALSGDCGGGGSPEVVQLLAGDGQTYCIDTGGSAFDTVLYVFENVCEDGAGLICNDDGGGLPDFASQLELDTAFGSAYLIVVDGYSGQGQVNSGAYVLSITPGACP